MTNKELENIIDAIDNDHRLRGERRADHIKLLRSIEIAALREAREVAAKRDNGENIGITRTIEELTRKIVELELR